jgi:hypothetical protein
MTGATCPAPGGAMDFIARRFEGLGATVFAGSRAPFTDPTLRCADVGRCERRTGDLPRYILEDLLFGLRFPIAMAPKELAQNGVRRDTVPARLCGARRTLCAPK